MSIESKVDGVLSGVCARTYGAVAPQGTAYPYIVFTLVSRAREQSHGGYARIDRPRVQVSIYAKTYGEAKSVAASVLSAMEAAEDRGFLANEMDAHEAGVYNVTQDYFINYEED